MFGDKHRAIHKLIHLGIGRHLLDTHHTDSCKYMVLDLVNLTKRPARQILPYSEISVIKEMCTQGCY